VADQGVDGAILGRSLYEGTLEFAAAQSLADSLCGVQDAAAGPAGDTVSGPAE
jgi:phosphoribosylformimino-5-aminoimidazole carboxamide ribotide isomerase